MKKAIIIMAKIPEAGKVKTRLQPFLPPKQSEKLSIAFLQDTEKKAFEVINNLYVAVSPFDERDKLKGILQHPNSLIEQKGNNLGEKMINAFESVFALGVDSIVMVGTDSPTFPAKYIDYSFDLLRRNEDVVIGRTADGGFYLLGLKKIYTEIFEDVVWSSENTFTQIEEKVMTLGLSLNEITDWYDIDEKEDLLKLKTEFLENKDAKRIAPNTYKWVQSSTYL